MEMSLPEDSGFLLSPKSLRKVLNYSPQHRIVIGKTLKKAFADRWPDERSITEQLFYESLFLLLENIESRSAVCNSLNALAERKNKYNWKEVLIIPLRIIGCSLDLVKDRQIVSDVLKNKESGFKALFEQLDAEGHPEFRCWYRWSDIYLDYAVETDDATTPPETPNTPPDALLAQWQALMDELDIRTHSAREAPSLELVQWLEQHVTRLQDVAHRYAEVTDLSDLLEQCRQTLDGLEAEATPDVQERISKARDALARYQGQPQPLEHWLERLQQHDQDALRAVIAEEREHKEAMKAAANQDDYDEVSRRSMLAKAAHERYAMMVEALAGLFAALEALSSDSTTDPVAAEEHSTETATPDPNPPAETSARSDHTTDTSPAEPSSASVSPEASAPASVETTPLVTPDLPDVAEDPPDVPQALPITPPVQTVDAVNQVVEPASDQPVVDLDKCRAETAVSTHWDPQIQVSALIEEVNLHEGPQQIACAQALAWALTRDGDIQTAYHLAKAVAADVGPLDIRPEPLLAIHLGDSLSSNTGEEVDELAKTLRQFYDIGFIDDHLRTQRPMTLLLYSALLRPTLVAPDMTGARELLRALPLDGPLTGLHELRELILAPDFHYRGILHLTQGAELDELRARADEWWQGNRHHTFNYPPANLVWRKLLEPEQGLGRALAIVTQGTDKVLEEARSQLRELQNQTRIERMIQEADEDVRGRAARRHPIEARPVKDMVRRAAQVAELLEQWLSLHASRLQSGPDMAREQAQRATKHRLLRALDNAHTQVAVLSEEATDLPGRAAACCMAVVLTRVRDTLQGVRAGHSELSTWWRRLNGVLLPLRSVRLEGPHWTPIVSSPEPSRLSQLGELLQVPDWRSIFNEADRCCNHVKTGQILDWLRYEEPEKGAELLEELERDRDRGLARCREVYRQEFSKVQEEVEQAASHGYLGEAERSSLVARLEAAGTVAGENLERALGRLQDIHERLGELREQQVAEIRRRVDHSHIPQSDPEAHQRICELLAAGDILTSNEYVALLEDGKPIPGPTEHRDPFDEFFPLFVERMRDYLGNRHANEVIADVGRRKIVGPLDMGDVPGMQAQSAEKMLRAWHNLKGKRGGEIAASLRDFLEALGFTVSELNPLEDIRRDGRELAFDLSARSIADRDICVVPRYGSHAAGQYRLLCMWQRPAEDEVLTSAHARSAGRVPIVLYLGQLTAKRRRDLAFRSRERNQTLLVIDETLVYFLCGERGSRLATLFSCAMPFTVAQPYVTTSSDVPPELFFGRRREIEEVFHQEGTNLVYGGRQLGKTALLRAVVRRYHEPTKGIFVSWIDLKERHIGLSQPAADVWGVIDHELVQLGVLPKARRSPDSTADAVRRWLDEKPERRIVMLLDEADAFLAQDAHDEQFRIVGTLKGLMERSGRRFKVVFAGLHNVQRTSRDVNTPLAHFGKPVCVGPLLENGEAREAHLLVERPFRQLGFRFESPALINRILAQANYYPNLIQIFCSHLLRYLNDVGTVRFDSRETPPYIITREHIETVSRSRDLQQIIRDRFQITLDLDNRYLVTALVVALETQERQAGGEEVDGFNVAWIRQHALSWWPAGFPDRSYDAFRALLDEMVGLGVLRRTGAHMADYALRSPAIAGLLGSRDEIEQALLDAGERSPPILYEAASYRRRKAGDPWVRSPLTGQQESEILTESDGVVLLFGTVLAGLDRVESFLTDMVNEKDFVEMDIIRGIQDAKSFGERLRSASNSFKGEGIHLFVVPYSEPWTPAWIELAGQHLRRRRSTRLTTRLLFLGDSQDAWDWLESAPAQIEDVGMLSLGPWTDPFPGQWVQDAGFGPLGDSDLKQWSETTGWWGRLMAQLGEALNPDPTAWQQVFHTFQHALPDRLREAIEQDIPADLTYPLRLLAEYRDPLTEEDWLDLLTDQAGSADSEKLSRVVRWADLLSFLTPTEARMWRLDPVLARALRDE